MIRPYQPSDLQRVVQFVGECNALSDLCGYPHPGDVVHFMSNILRGQNHDAHFHLYEDDSSALVAFIMLYPVDEGAFDVLLHPQHRNDKIELDLLHWAEREAWALVQRAEDESDSVACDGTDCDPKRQELLLAAGYIPEDEPYQVCTTRDLAVTIPDSVLPEGFVIRSVAGEHEADALSEVHNAAFESDWLPGEYLTVMQTPGFVVEHELVVVAPDGRFAAFLVYWPDPVSKCGLFEPVGTHPEFHRRGLSRALMYEGMRRMVAAGMTRAMVRYDTDNEASTALYRAVGFETLYTVTDYRKAM